MDLNDFFFEIAATYDRADGLDAPAQRLLRDAHVHLAEHAPVGIKVMGSGGKGSPTFTPWIGYFDPDETVSPQYGIYVVYLFSEDLERVALSLNQGIEQLRRDYGGKAARQLLESQALSIRTLLRLGSLRGLSFKMDLGSRGDRQLAYEAGNIASTAYRTGSLPPEQALRSDLARFLGIYREAVIARQKSLTAISNYGISGLSSSAGNRLLVGFRPKNADEYRVRLQGKTLVKSRYHERLVREFGEHAASCGFRVSTPHPMDIVMCRDGLDWLVEVKVVYGGNATDAVRAAIGQLFTYRHFFYQLTSPPPRLLALFSEPIGAAYGDLLESLNIGAVWRVEDRWRATRSVEPLGLAPCEQPRTPG